MEIDNTHVAVDLDCIQNNFGAICRKAGVPVMAIVKADAYGHGAIQVARVLQKQCAFFGVSSMLEAMELRKAGITLPILILGRTPVCAYREAAQQGIRPAIFSLEDGKALSNTARELGVRIPFHFAVDTGMSRIGFQVSPESADLCARIAGLPGLEAEGIFSHFAGADSQDLSGARAQGALFDSFCAMLEQRGVQIPIKHLNNSAGIMNFQCHYDMVRAGIIIYGLYPSQEVSQEKLSIAPALSWQSRVTHVKLLEPGRAISYGGTFVTEKPTVVATVPVGYADGYRRSLSNGFYVLIRGKKARILGRVCMDQMMVDVTEIPHVRVDDPVTLVGTDGEETITMEQIAQAAGSFNYEFVCGISRRVPRLYWERGKIVHEVHYLLDQFQ